MEKQFDWNLLIFNLALCGVNLKTKITNTNKSGCVRAGLTLV